MMQQLHSHPHLQGNGLLVMPFSTSAVLAVQGLIMRAFAMLQEPNHIVLGAVVAEACLKMGRFSANHLVRHHHGVMPCTDPALLACNNQ